MNKLITIILLAISFNAFSEVIMRNVDPSSVSAYRSSNFSAKLILDGTEQFESSYKIDIVTFSAKLKSAIKNRELVNIVSTYTNGFNEPDYTLTIEIVSKSKAQKDYLINKLDNKILSLEKSKKELELKLADITRDERNNGKGFNYSIVSSTFSLYYNQRVMSAHRKKAKEQIQDECELAYDGQLISGWVEQKDKKPQEIFLSRICKY